MAKRRVIEDSDEEDDEPQASSPLSAAIPPNISLNNIVDPQSSNGCSVSNARQATVTRGISPDDLACDIQHANESLIKPMPNGNQASTKPISLSQQSLSSPKMPKRGMKRALSNIEMTSPGGHKTARTRGPTPGRESLRYSGSSDGEIERNPKAAVSNRKTPQPRRGLDDGNPGSIVMGDWVNLSDSTIESTITDISPAQPVPSGGVPASWSLNNVSGSGESNYMSRSMPPPAVSSRGTNDNVDTSPEDQTQINLRSSAIAALQTLPSSGSKDNLSSAASAMSPSDASITNEATAKDRRNLHSEYLEDELSRTSPLPHTTTTVNPIVLLPQRASAEAKSNRNSKTPQSLERTSDDLGSDDNAIGIPKEQYRPRLSRSRAGLDGSELVTPVDFSKKPESTTKTTVRRQRKATRSKSTSFEELRPPKNETKDEEEDSADETEKLAIPIWKDHSPKVQPEADEEHESVDENRGFEKHTLAETDKPAQKPKKQRGRPRKANKTERDERATKAAEGADDGVSSISDPAIGQMMHQTSKIGTVAELQTEHGDDEGERRSRCDSEYESNPKDDVPASNKVLEESAGNTSKQQASPSTEIKPLPETPKKSAQAADKKGPDKHSPLNSGKVAYRVGLSKRARIEPLLRVVRK